jgi:hypothetical protein
MKTQHPKNPPGSRLRLAWFSLLLLGFTACLGQAGEDDALNGVTKKGEKAFQIRGTNLVAITSEFKMPPEIVVNTNGTFSLANGKERTLQEGQVIRTDGTLLNPDGSIQPIQDHLAMKNARVVLVKDGESTPIAEPLRLTNGATITPDGIVIRADGYRTRLVDGQLFTMDGTPLPTKDSITLKNGRVIVQRDGSLIPLQPLHIMGMSEGSRVFGTGKVVKRDGTVILLKEGETVIIDGIVTR